MAWTHFTAPLVAGDVLTKEQRNELYSAFLERVAAADRVGDFTVPDELVNTDLATDLVYSADDADVVRLAAAISELAPSFVSPAVTTLGHLIEASAVLPMAAGSGDGAHSVWRAARIALGLTEEEATAALGSPSTLNVLDRWNLIRAAIQALTCVKLVIDPPSSVGFTRFSGLVEGFDAAVAAFYAAGESANDPTGAEVMVERFDPPPPEPGEEEAEPSYAIEGYCHTPTVLVPATAPFASYMLLGYREATAGAGLPSPIVGLTQKNSFGLGAAVVDVVDLGENMKLEAILALPTNATGGVVLDYRLSAYDSGGSSELGLLEPPEEAIYRATSRYNYVLAKPVFSYP